MKVDRRAWRGPKNGERAWLEIHEIYKWIICMKIYETYIFETCSQTP